jgi:chitin synthase
LGGVTASKVDGKDTVEIEILTDLNDINTNYEKFISRLAVPRPAENNKRDAKTKTEDYYKTFRTRVVLSWIFTNALVVIVVTNPILLGEIRKQFLITKNPDGTVPPGNPFLQFIFWSVFALSTIRFTGSTLYLVFTRIFG